MAHPQPPTHMPTGPAPPAPRSLPRRLLLCSAAVLLVLAALELALRLSGLQPVRLEEGLRNLDGELPSLHNPPLATLTEQGDGYRTSDTILQGSGYSKVAGEGPGLQRFGRSRPPGALRVAFFGGSNTYGFLSQTNWPARVGQLLQQRTGRPVQIYNAAQIGMPSTIIMYAMPEILHYFRPDIVLLQTAHNELLDIPQFYLIEQPHSFWARKFLDLADHTYLYSLLRRLYVEKLSAYKPTYEVKNASPFTKSRWNAQMVGLARERLWRNLRQMKRFCDFFDAKLVLVTAPYAANKIEDLRVFAMFAHPRSSSPGRMARAEALFVEAERALQGHQLDRARAVLQRLDEPEHGYTWALRGRLAELSGKLPEARRAYARAMALSWRPIGNGMNPLLRAFAEEYDLPLVDAQQALLDVGRQGVMDLKYFADFFHPNAAGHEVVAEAAVRELLRAGLVQQGSPPPLAPGAGR